MKLEVVLIVVRIPLSMDPRMTQSREEKRRRSKAMKKKRKTKKTMMMKRSKTARKKKRSRRKKAKKNKKKKITKVDGNAKKNGESGNESDKDAKSDEGGRKDSKGENKDANDAGMVAVYELDDSGQEWVQLGDVITSKEPRGNDEFGFSVDLKGDILVVGIPGRGRQGQVDFFQYDSTTRIWSLHPDSLQGEEGSNFGYSVRLADSFLAVGSAITSGDNAGRVQVYSQS